MWGRLFNIILVLSLIFISLGIFSELAAAGPDQQVIPELGPIIRIWDDAGSNSNPAIAYNSLHDEFLVVWATMQDAFSTDIWARRLHSDGSPISSGVFNIDNFAGIHLIDPAVSYNPQTDQYLVVYTAEFSMEDHDIWGKVVNWNGSLSSRLYIDNRGQVQNSPAVVYNPRENQYLVAYSDWQTANTVNVRLKTLDQAGGEVDNAEIISASGQFRGTPDLAHNPRDNQYMVVYGYEGSFLPRIMGKSFSATLGSTSPEFHYNDDGIGGMEPVVACNLQDCLVTWQGLMGSGVKARRTALDGSPLGTVGGFEIAAPIPDIIQEAIAVTWFDPWGYLVSWNQFLSTSGNTSDVMGALVGSKQDTLLGNIFPLDDRLYFAGWPEMACAPSGSCLFVDTHNPVEYPNGDNEINGRLVFTHRNYIPLAIR
jgi:hypothetical protein